MVINMKKCLPGEMVLVFVILCCVIVQAGCYERCFTNQ